MKNKILYRSYCGDEPYILLKYGEPDEKIAVEIVNRLVKQMFRIHYSGRETIAIEDADRLAERMLSSELVVFLISAEALESLAFRNAVHYALNREKELFCIFLDDKPLAHGLALQLSGVPGVHLSEYKNPEDLCQSIVTGAPFTQRMRGEDAKVKADVNRSKKRMLMAAAGVMALLILVGAGVAAYRVHFENSLPGQIERITEADYLDLSGEDASLLERLDGKIVRVLIAQDMGLKDVEALATVRCEELDLSHNPKIGTLEPLLQNGSLRVVTVSQDMAPAVGMISGRHSFRVLIEE